jgi:hypothetical protein
MKPSHEDPDGRYAEVIRIDPVTSPMSPALEARARSRASRAHGLAIFGMALSALAGTLALLAFITIRWPGETAQLVRVVFVLSGVAFMACAAMAVFFAMRETHPQRREGKGEHWRDTSGVVVFGARERAKSDVGRRKNRRTDGAGVEIEGHPTQDLVEELERRGALRIDGTSAGPREDALRFAAEQLEDNVGFWLFLPRRSFMTGVDDPL